MRSGLPDILRQIVERRAAVLAQAPPVSEDDLPSFRSDPLRPDENAFLEALASRGGHAVIAEVKLGSPSLGRLPSDFKPETQARVYGRHGAAALSVVVEPDFFYGSYELLNLCRVSSDLPALAKDFVIDERQLTWAADAGAGAVLLIARLLDRERLIRLAGLARGLGLAPLIETHDEADLQKLDGREWECVGFNHRDLSTFEVDLDRSQSLLPRFPQRAIRVAESGISRPADVHVLRERGFSAFLVGESLLVSERPGRFLEDLVGQNVG